VTDARHVNATIRQCRPASPIPMEAETWLGSRPLGVREPVYVPGLPVFGGSGALFSSPLTLDREWPAALVQGGCNVSTAKRETQRGHRRLRSTVYRAHHVGARNHQFERFLSGGACDGALPPRSSRTPGAPSSGRSARLGPVFASLDEAWRPGGGEEPDPQNDRGSVIAPVVVEWSSFASWRTAGTGLTGSPAISPGDGRAS
jgi:hypothetical protein